MSASVLIRNLEPVRVGDQAYDFTLPDQTGTPRTLTTLLDAGPVVLFFFPAAMSKGCTKETCHFRDLSAELDAYSAHPVGISMDDVARQLDFAQKNRITFPLLADVDGEVARRYGVKRHLDFLRVKRTTFVIDTHQRIAAIINSEVSMNAHADRALEVLRTLRG